MKRRTIHLSEGGLLAEVLAAALTLPAAEATALVERGAVYVDGRRARQPNGPVRAGATLAVILEEGGRSVLETAPSSAPLAVLWEDRDLIAVDKPPGLTAQPTAGKVGDSLLDLVSARLGRPAGLVHRLDKETSGVTVFGKNAEATARLAAAFREGRAKKQYVAVTIAGLPPSGSIRLPLSKDPSRPGRWRASAKANGVPAETHFTRLAEGPVCVVALFPQTGRTHQLRAHLAGIGHPIVGDRLYGGPSGPRCLLHAWVLELDGQRFVAPIPDDLRQAVAQALGAWEWPAPGGATPHT